MILRRSFLAGAAALAATPRFARADAPQINLRGSLEQGSLVIGDAGAGATVTVDGNSVLVSTEGLFAFGIAYNADKPVKIAATFADGSEASRQAIPVVRQYQIQKVNGLPQKFVTPPPEELARIHREALTIDAARNRDTPGVGFSQTFEWPLPGIISSVYGSQRIDNGVPMAPHLGVDIAAPEGTPIHAPADAVVSIADDYFLDGGFTLLDHGHGVSTCYLHQSRRMVKAGDAVKRGDIIGLVGQTGRATGPHTHWGLNWFQVKLDPSLSTATPEPPKL